METLSAIYKNSCPNCGGDISSERLALGLFCEKCMSENEDKCAIPGLKNYKPFCDARALSEEFFAFFKEKMGSEPNEIQKMWAKRFFLDNSFALLAPTGIGKTTFGLLLAAFLKTKGKKSYILFPTKLLVKQAKEKLSRWNVDALCYTGKKEEKEKIAKGDFEILITTTQFLYKNTDIIPTAFYFVFVDDVDSVLKSGRKISDVLRLVGFSAQDIDNALHLITERDYGALEAIAQHKKGNLIVSSATANPRSKRIKLFTHLLHFDVSKPVLNLRNIYDVYAESSDVYLDAVHYIKRLGPGGLVFLPGSSTKKELEDFINYLKAHEINAVSYEDFDAYIEQFKQGKVIFVGFASYKNPLGRGLDLPEYVRYALFAGVPKIAFRISEENYKALYFVLLALLPFFARNRLLSETEMVKLQNMLNYLRQYAFITNPAEKVKSRLYEISAYVSNLLELFKDEIKNAPDLSFNGESIVTADITGYIQASGRTSRFLNGHLTKGLSVVLAEDKKAFYSLRKKLKWFADADFTPISEVNLDEILQQVDESRKHGEKLRLKTTFIVVESPTKARTISSFFGKPSRRLVNGIPVYEVLLPDRVLVITASVGHDFDLVQTEGRYGVLKKHIPVFEVLENKNAILDAMHIESSTVSEILVATDPDREGEKIAFDISLINKPFNGNIKRMEFHEITKRAITNAIENPRELDLNLVASQFVRRISDRWVGFTLSQYVQDLLNRKTLSAGRVQTPVLGWICERTEKLREKVYAVKMKINGVDFIFEFDSKAEADALFKKEKIAVQKISEQTEKLTVTPFNTSALLREASAKLHFSPQKTMQLAQELFENGLITYHRTDSIRVSSFGIGIAREFIEANFGAEYFAPRAFSGAAGAHECIRPVKAITSDELRALLLLKSVRLSSAHFRLYDLIFRRFIASQMKETVAKKTRFLVEGREFEFLTEIKESGFDKIYPVYIVHLTEGEYAPEEKQIFAKPKCAPYTYADIIEMMKERGIGRPSTYAITLQKLLERKYIVEKNGFLFATRLGFKVFGVISKSPLNKYADERFTKELEEVMDRIEQGKENYITVLYSLYDTLFPSG